MDISMKIREKINEHASLINKLSVTESAAYHIGVADAIGAIDTILNDYIITPKDSEVEITLNNLNDDIGIINTNTHADATDCCVDLVGHISYEDTIYGKADSSCK